MSDTERDKLARTIRSVTDLWDEPLDEVHDIPPIVNAILAEFLPEHDKAVKADAWDEGAAACWDGNDMQYPNPHRRSA